MNEYGVHSGVLIIDTLKESPTKRLVIEAHKRGWNIHLVAVRREEKILVSGDAKFLASGVVLYALTRMVEAETVLDDGRQYGRFAGVVSGWSVAVETVMTNGCIIVHHASSDGEETHYAVLSKCSCGCGDELDAIPTLYT